LMKANKNSSAEPKLKRIMKNYFLR
jgi:hypothetical protein